MVPVLELSPQHTAEHTPPCRVPRDAFPNRKNAFSFLSEEDIIIQDMYIMTPKTTEAKRATIESKTKKFFLSLPLNYTKIFWDIRDYTSIYNDITKNAILVKIRTKEFIETKVICLQIIYMS